MGLLGMYISHMQNYTDGLPTDPTIIAQRKDRGGRNQRQERVFLTLCQRWQKHQKPKHFPSPSGTSTWVKVTWEKIWPLPFMSLGSEASETLPLGTKSLGNPTMKSGNTSRTSHNGIPSLYNCQVQLFPCSAKASHGEGAECQASSTSFKVFLDFPPTPKSCHCL